MLNHFITEVKLLPVLVAAILYWVVGAIWYMAVFQKPWAAGIAKWGLQIGQQPDKGPMFKKMIISFLCNLGAIILLAWFINVSGVYNAMIGAKLGFATGLLGVFVFAMGDNWLSKPLSTFLVDASYHNYSIDPLRYYYWRVALMTDA